MAFNPTGTKWSVAPFNQDGTIGSFHPTPWEFNRQSMNSGSLWAGGYQAVKGADNTYDCEVLAMNASDPTESFQVVFVTADRFVATKNGALYRFGKKI
jgi:hypothetical protein